MSVDYPRVESEQFLEKRFKNFNSSALSERKGYINVNYFWQNSVEVNIGNMLNEWCSEKSILIIHISEGCLNKLSAKLVISSIYTLKDVLEWATNLS